MKRSSLVGVIILVVVGVVLVGNIMTAPKSDDIAALNAAGEAIKQRGDMGYYGYRTETQRQLAGLRVQTNWVVYAYAGTNDGDLWDYKVTVDASTGQVVKVQHYLD